MGSPVRDLLLEVEQGESLEERNQLAEGLLLEGAWRDEIQDVSALRIPCDPQLQEQCRYQSRQADPNQQDSYSRLSHLYGDSS